MQNRNYKFGHGTFLPVEARNLVTTAIKETVLTLERTYKPIVEPHALEAIDEGNKYSGDGLFGLPVWDVIELRYSSGGFTQTALLPICQVEVTQSRNIITTAVQGLDGTIKEFISAGDNQIKIRATIVGDAADYYPGTEIQNIIQVLDVKDAINVYSIVLNKYFDISSIVVTDYHVSQPEIGMRNVQIIEIDCITDNPDVYEIIMQVA